MSNQTSSLIVPDGLEPLPLEEQSKFATLEDKMEENKRIVEGSFQEFGEALNEICESRLYRAKHKTFESYVQSRWNMTPRRAYQIIEARATFKLLVNQVHIPSERVARELSGLSDDEKIKAGKSLSKVKDKKGKIGVGDAKVAALKASPKKAAAAKTRQENEEKETVRKAENLVRKGKVKVESTKQPKDVAEAIGRPPQGGIYAESKRNQPAAAPDWSVYSSGPRVAAQSPAKAPKIFDAPEAKRNEIDPIKAIDKWWNSADGKRWHTYPWPGKPIDLVNVIKGLLA